MPDTLAALGITRKGLGDRLAARVDAVLPTPSGTNAPATVPAAATR